MLDWSELGIPDEEAEELEDLDLIPGLVELIATKLSELLCLPEPVKATSMLDLIEKFLEFLPDLDTIKTLAQRVQALSEEESDPPFDKMVNQLASFAQAINRRDQLYHVKLVDPKESFAPIPWMWFTGEPNTGRRDLVTGLLRLCPEREHVDIVYCDSENEESLIEEVFGNYFAPGISEDEKPKGKLFAADMGFLIFFEPKHLSLLFQRRLIQWKDNCSLKPWWSEDQPGSKPRESPKNAKDEMELVDAGIIFISEQGPRELMKQGVISNGLVSGAVHINVPPLRNQPKLIIDSLQRTNCERGTDNGDRGKSPAVLDS